MAKAGFAFRALLGLLAAFVLVIPLMNILGAKLSDAAGITEGHARLRMDLLWIFLAGVAGCWACLRIAKAGFAWLALTFLLIALTVDLWAVIDAWEQWPRWFSLGVMLSLPLQVALGWWLSGPHRRRSRVGALQI